MLATLAGVQAAGWRVSVLAPAHGPLAETLAACSIPHLPFDTRASDGSRLGQAALREKLAEVLRARRPDLLHANSLAMGRLSGPIARELGIPSLSHLRDIIGLSRQAIEDLNAHTRLLAVSYATRNYHVAQGLPAEKTHVLYNGIDLNKFCPRAATGYLHREFGIPREAPIIGTIGQVGLRKGQDTLFFAAALGTLKSPLPHYLIVGERNSDKAESVEFERHLHTIATEQLPGRIHFLGRRTDVPSLLHELTLLVHPARQEPLGRVLLEAAASGVPIVATDVGGTAEILPPDANAARLVPAGDPTALAAAMRALLDNAPLRQTLATNARRRIEARFSIDLALAGLLKHYKDVLTLQ